MALGGRIADRAAADTILRCCSEAAWYMLFLAARDAAVIEAQRKRHAAMGGEL
jgi:hypothetical protein